MQKNSDFPEFFRRFESKIDFRSMNKDFDKLHMAIAGYAGKKWVDSSKQQLALAREADRRGFENITITEWVEKPKRKRLTARARWERRTRIGNTAPTRKTSRAKKSTINRAIKIELVKDYVDKKYSANEIQRELKKEKMGMRRKELLKVIRQYKNKQLKKDSKKYIPKKHRKND